MITAPFHLTVDKTSLYKALAHCQGVVERRNTVPILSHVLFEAQAGTLKITATDLDLSLQETIPANIRMEGNTTVLAHLLFDVVRKLPNGAEIELKVEKEGEMLLLQSGKSSYTFPCLPPIEFPSMKEEKLPCHFKMKSEDLTFLIDKTRFSMSTEETRYYLNGIFFHKTTDGFLRAVTTDGLRLAQAQVNLPADASAMPSVIMSRKTIQELRKLVDETKDELSIALSENQVRFTIGATILISRLIEGKFPDYEQVIPFGNDKTLEVNVKAFAEAVDRISLMSTDKLHPIKIHVENQVMSISAHSTETGSAVEELDVSYSGDSMDLGFNARFILDVAQQISNSTLQFLIGGPHQAVILKDIEETTSLYVLMPMRV